MMSGQGLSRAIRRCSLAGSPAERGARHGSLWGSEIRRYCADRVELAAGAGWTGRELGRGRVLEIAEQLLPAHQSYAPDLYDEMAAMASAAGISPAEAVIVGGFTDFVDVLRALGPAPVEDHCTAALIPRSQGGGSTWYAQTWDMHASATEHVVVLEPAEPAAVIFSTVGCIGQIGMNEAGIGVGITNLTATDGRIGVTWPFVVREALRQTSLAAALRVVCDAPVAGGHTFLLVGPEGGYEVERMPTCLGVRVLADEALVHTNHCLHPTTAQVEAARAEELKESSLARLARASSLMRGPVELDALIALTRERTAICRRADDAHGFETSGAVILRPDTREMWAVWGLPSEHAYERFEVGHG